jgi:NAD(P)-dependent dehydrogenase (short-subunit alcohol dehydrogenase family)
MPHDFTGQVALVTGGGSGIGRAAALALAAGGARLVAADVDEAGAAETVRLVEAGGGEAAAVRVDVTRPADCAAAVDLAVARFGGLDLAVNAAGVGGVEARTADYPEDDWHRTLAVNLTGVWNAMRAELPAILARTAGRAAAGEAAAGGAVVNVASVAGLVGFPAHAAYAASKHGVVGLTRTAALEYARRGVRVNALCPGFTRTPMVDRITGATARGRGRARRPRPDPAARHGGGDRRGGGVPVLARGGVHDRARARGRWWPRGGLSRTAWEGRPRRWSAFRLIGEAAHSRDRLATPRRATSGRPAVPQPTRRSVV